MTQGVPGEDEMTSGAGPTILERILDGREPLLDLMSEYRAAIEQEVRDEIRARVEAVLGDIDRREAINPLGNVSAQYRAAALAVISSSDDTTQRSHVGSSATEHVHEWEDAPDDETGWHCPGCGVTEYPGMKDELTPNEFVEPSSATENRHESATPVVTQDGERPGDGLVPALAYALARADLPGKMETSRDYATRLAPLVIESGYLTPTPDDRETQDNIDAGSGLGSTTGSSGLMPAPDASDGMELRDAPSASDRRTFGPESLFLASNALKRAIPTTETQDGERPGLREAALALAAYVEDMTKDGLRPNLEILISKVRLAATPDDRDREVELREALDGVTDVTEHFIRKYGLATTSGEKHIVRRDLRNLALNVINEARAAISSSSATETRKIDLWGNPNRAERMRSGADHGDFFIGSGLCKTCREPYPCKASEEPLPSSATETQDGERPAFRITTEGTPEEHARARRMAREHGRFATPTPDMGQRTPDRDDRDREVERIAAVLEQVDVSTGGSLSGSRPFIGPFALAARLYDAGLRASGGTE